MTYAIDSLKDGPLVSFGTKQGHLLLQVMRRGSLGWLAHGFVCPDCLTADVTRASAVAVLRKSLDLLDADPSFLASDRTVWTSGNPTRAVLRSALADALEALADVTDPVVRITDLHRYCTHPRATSAKAAPRKPPEPR